MTDDKARKLIRKSIIRTSPHFTDELMYKVALQRIAERKLKVYFWTGCLASAVLLLILLNGSVDINFATIKLKFSPLTMRVLGSVFVFIMLNRLIVLRGRLLDTSRD